MHILLTDKSGIQYRSISTRPTGKQPSQKTNTTFSKCNKDIKFSKNYQVSDNTYRDVTWVREQRKQEILGIHHGSLEAK